MVTFPGGERWPAIGLGTWRMGEDASCRTAEVAAVRRRWSWATASSTPPRCMAKERAEQHRRYSRWRGDALRFDPARAALHRQQGVSRTTPAAAGRWQRANKAWPRLGLDQLDAYLLHWRGAVPLAETVAAFETLRHGVGSATGVSATSTSRHAGPLCRPRRSALRHEPGLLFARASAARRSTCCPGSRRHGIVTMAYSPIDQGALGANAGLRAIAASARHHVGADRSGVARRATRCHGHPEGRAHRAPAREPAAANLELGVDEQRRSTVSSRRLGGARRWPSLGCRGAPVRGGARHRATARPVTAGSRRHPAGQFGRLRRARLRAHRPRHGTRGAARRPRRGRAAATRCRRGERAGRSRCRRATAASRRVASDRGRAPRAPTAGAFGLDMIISLDRDAAALRSGQGGLCVVCISSRCRTALRRLTLASLADAMGAGPAKERDGDQAIARRGGMGNGDLHEGLLWTSVRKSKTARGAEQPGPFEGRLARRSAWRQPGGAPCAPNA